MKKKFLNNGKLKFFCSFALILCFLVSQSYFHFLPSNADEEINVDVVAHRGYAGIYPENTLSSFKGAVRCGAGSVEFDVRKTADDVLIIFHDDTLERFTGDTTPIEEYTYDELKEIKIGSYFSEVFEHDTIPTLDQALDILTSSGINIFCELKDIGEDEAFPSEVYMDFANRGLLDRTVFSSFNYDYLTSIKSINPSQPIMVLASFGKSTLPVNYPAEYYGINMRTLSERTIVAIHDAGAKVYAYTPDSRYQVLNLQRLGVDGVITDFPEMQTGSYVDETIADEAIEENEEELIEANEKVSE